MLKWDIPPEMSPVAVTGIGMICPLGLNASSSWDNLLEGKSGIRVITKFEPEECETRIGGQLPDGYAELEKGNTSRRLIKQTVLATRMARLCTIQAIEDSGLDTSALDPYRCGVIFGTSGSSVRSPGDLGGKSAQRYKIIREMTNAIPAWISIQNSFKGPSYTVSAACASGPYAVAQAVDLIRAGHADVVISGGVDCLLTKNNVLRGNKLGLLSRMNDVPEKAVKPFDRRRDGWVLSDGGCAFVLESRSHAVRRGARVYAWVRGYATLFNGSESPGRLATAAAMAEAMKKSLENSRLSLHQVDYINAHGSATVASDRDETEAIKAVFGKHAVDLPTSSQKSMLGHLMGAAGAVEFAITALALKHEALPPTINYEHSDPACDLDYVPNKMRPVPGIDIALTNCFAIGGHNSVIVMQRAP